MGVKLVFLGRLADLTGVAEREVSAPLDWSTLLDALQGELGGWLASDKVKLAVNGTLLADKMALQANDGDEVALLPPVSGG
ncbi:MAG TPA: MoaD/ThiS family protein [Croceibacterium sp.]